jgi:hypothetical protein
MFFSCTKDDKNSEYVKNNFNSYNEIYRVFKDSLLFYSNSNLKGYNYINENDWELDSLILVNSTDHHLITVVLISSGTGKEGKSDGAIFFLGKKINNQWYFFQGSTLIVPRDAYGKDENHPLIFHELSQIARKEMFGENCLIKKDGKWIVNDKWVDYFFYNSGVCGHCKTKEQFDSAHWAAINKKWKHKIDTAEFKKQSGNYP